MSTFLEMSSVREFLNFGKTTFHSQCRSIVPTKSSFIPPGIAAEAHVGGKALGRSCLIKGFGDRLSVVSSALLCKPTPNCRRLTMILQRIQRAFYQEVSGGRRIKPVLPLLQENRRGGTPIVRIVGTSSLLVSEPNAGGDTRLH